MRESMHKTPRRHGCVIVIERPWVEVGDAAHQHRLDARTRCLKRWVFRTLGENRPKHEAKKAAVLIGELDIGKTSPDQGIGAPGRALHGLSELVETLGRDGSKEILLVGEMA